VVDVGGGNGALIAQVLTAHPALRATLFDLEAGLEGADAYLRGRGVRGRCDLAVGSFFEAIPEDADTYLLKYILHDWDNGRAAEILAVCRRAMRPGARITRAASLSAPAGNRLSDAVCPRAQPKRI